MLHGLFPDFRESTMRVELDKRALFALASDTRLDILKSLQPMRRTVTQLAETLGIDKAAVHRHLKTLEEGGLVKRYEDHGFVYYGLSWKTRDLLSPGENTKVVILLSSFFVLVGIAVVLSLAAAAVYDPGDIFGRAVPSEGSDDQYQSDTGGLSSSPAGSLMLLAACGLTACVGIFAVYHTVRTLRRPKQPCVRPEEAE